MQPGFQRLSPLSWPPLLFPRCPLRCALVRWITLPWASPHHGQQEGKRRNRSLVLASQFSQAVRRTIGSAKAGSSCLLSIRWVKQDPPRPERPKKGFLGVEPLSVFLVTFCTSKKLPHGVRALPPRQALPKPAYAPRPKAAHPRESKRPSAPLPCVRGLLFRPKPGMMGERI